MNILISNDDGHQAPGLHALYTALVAHSTCQVVAPNRNRSAASQALTLFRPLRAVKQANGFIAVDGTPADCVYLAVHGLTETTPDMVVSGINSGMNMGDDVLYSGTVAAAIEGRSLAKPALAISMSSYTPEHYSTGGAISARIVKQMMNEPLPDDMILNINIPDVPLESIQGIRSTRLGLRHKSAKFVATHDPRGETLYWVGPPGEVADAEPGTDFHAVANGFVSVTPLHIDMTQYSAIDALAQWVEKIS